MKNINRETISLELDRICKAIAQEEQNSANTLHMTANENIMSDTARQFMDSDLSFRYYSDTYDKANSLLNQKHYLVGSAVYRGLPAVYEFETLARYYSNQMFHAAFSDFSPLSGMHGVICMITTLTKPGDKIFAFSTQSIGHHATHQLFKNLGRIPIEVPWDDQNLSIDFKKFKEVFENEKPSLIFLDLGKALYPLPLKEMRDIAGPEIKMIYDGSHVLGLIAGGQFQNPLQEGCDILIGNTHKTFPGPQKAILLYADEELGRKIGAKLFETAVSSQHTHHSLALYATILEMSFYGKEYAEQIVKNAQAFSTALIAQGFTIVSKKNELPKSHVVAISGHFPAGSIQACQSLHLSGISTNTQRIFGFDCVRAGVQELTRRGMKEQEMEEIASFFKKIIIDQEPKIDKKVLEFNLKYKEIFYAL